MLVQIDTRIERTFPIEYQKIIENVAFEVLKFCGQSMDVEISVSIVDNAEIRHINKQFRNIDRDTDVLSFPLVDLNEDCVIDGTCLGDIIISYEKAQAQAHEYGHSLEREIGFLTAHSMLHLLGYDHMDEASEKIMFDKQEHILNQMGLTR